MKAALSLAVAAAFLSNSVLAQENVVLLDGNGQIAKLSDIDKNFIMGWMTTLNLEQCNAEKLSTRPFVSYRFLQVPIEDLELYLVVQPDVISTGEVLIYSEAPDGGLQEYTSCNTATLLPVLALMVTAPVEEQTRVSLMQQHVLAQNSSLTTYEPNYLMMRNDNNDADTMYMDFTLSSKYPVFPNEPHLNAFHDKATSLIENVLPGDDEFFMQFYIGFSGRFSQYLGTRDSSPVVSRRYNPSIFYRIWGTEVNYFDIGIGHESNGQRITSEEAYMRAAEDFAANGEPREHARDGISRGWDYNFAHWQHDWNDNLVTGITLRHYLPDGPMQGPMEEYNLWEDGGTHLRPRDKYDGLSLNAQYLFNRSRCLLSELPFCFKKMEITQETGYAKMFENNTTTLEFTSDIFGLPIQLWTKTGYNSNLVDYYQYTTSYGFGIELLSR
ncbi:MAG: hypothetical protein V4628_00620 [Pseudomonadota bacterium]